MITVERERNKLTERKGKHFDDFKLHFLDAFLHRGPSKTRVIKPNGNQTLRKFAVSSPQCSFHFSVIKLFRNKLTCGSIKPASVTGKKAAVYLV